MAEIDSSYSSAKVGIEQGAETLYIKSDGQLKFFDQDVTGSELKALIGAQINVTTIINSAGVLSTTTIPSNTGFVILSIADAASDASAFLPSCTQGQVMVLMARGVGSIGSVFISNLAGVSIVGFISGDMSSISFHLSANSQPFIRFACLSDNEWSVLETAGQVTLNASA